MVHPRFTSCCHGDCFPICIIHNFPYLDHFRNFDDLPVSYSLDFSGEVLIFDKNGDLLKLELKATFKVAFWCENDGGMQFRPTWKTSIEKPRFKRKIKAIGELQNIACFALINPTTAKIDRPDYKVSKDIVLEGDYDNDGAIDCFLWTYLDDSENCSGQPVNHLAINLQRGKRSIPLRCCGP